MNYSHLQALGNFESGQTGIKVNQASIIIPLKANQSEYNIEERSSVENNHVVGIYVTAPEATPQKISLSKTLPAAEIWNSIVLELRKDQEVVLERIPFTDIKKANDNGKPYYVQLGGKVNLSESKVLAFKNDTIVDGTAVDIRFDFVKLKV
ncbi:MAG: hypothetical protein AAF705_12670 [Bacteroidota bacterium]